MTGLVTNVNMVTNSLCVKLIHTHITSDALIGKDVYVAAPKGGKSENQIVGRVDHAERDDGVEQGFILDLDRGFSPIAINQIVTISAQ